MPAKSWTGESILAARKERGLTQVELADFLGCRPQTISEWETGLYDPKNAYQRLLDVFFSVSRGNLKGKKLK